MSVTQAWLVNLSLFGLDYVLIGKEGFYVISD